MKYDSDDAIIAEKQTAFVEATPVEKERNIREELLAVIEQYIDISPPEIAGTLARLKAQIEIHLKN